jgi:hypothetical protein
MAFGVTQDRVFVPPGQASRQRTRSHVDILRCQLQTGFMGPLEENYDRLWNDKNLTEDTNAVNNHVCDKQPEDQVFTQCFRSH